MNDKFKKLFTSDRFYGVVKAIANFGINSTETMLKEWLGTVIGQRMLKWLIDILITKFYDQIIDPIIRVGVIRVGYYYDVHDAKDKIKKLKNAEDANDKELYLRTLNDILVRKLP